MPNSPTGSIKSAKVLAFFETALAVIDMIEIYYGELEVYKFTPEDSDTFASVEDNMKFKGFLVLTSPILGD